MEICRIGKGIHHIRKAGWLIPIQPGNEAKVGVDNLLPYPHVSNYTQAIPTVYFRGFYHQVLVDPWTSGIKFMSYW